MDVRAIIVSIIENCGNERAEAADMILRVMGHDALPIPAAASEPPPTPRPRRKHHAGTGPRPKAPPELADGAIQPFEWYAIPEIEKFLGVGSDQIRHMIRTQPEELPHRRERPEGAKAERIEVLGRHIIALRQRRAKLARNDADSGAAADA